MPQRANSTPAAIWAATALVVLMALLGTWFSGLLRTPIDFTAFRCGGLIVAAGGDPYHVEPLRRCEIAALATADRHLAPHLVVPAPLPPYGLLLFAPFGSSRPPLPSAVWVCVLAVFFAITCVLLITLTPLPGLAVISSLALADLLASVVVGQLTPLEIGFIVLAAVALERRHVTIAALAAASTLIVPPVGLPVVIALALWEPRSRLALALGTAALGGISLLPNGPRLDIEYLTAIIPAQAASEGLNPALQFGLSGQLALFGVAGNIALAVGIISYTVMLLLGLRAGRALARTYGQPAFAIFTPAAFALIGGIYTHIHQIAVALPLALLLAGHVTRTRRTLVLSLVLLSIPWQTIGEIATYTPVPPAKLIATEHLMDLVDDDDSLAAGVWGVWVKTGASIGHNTAFTIAEKVPTWIGLICLLFVTFEAAGNPLRGAARDRKRQAPDPA